MKGALNMRDWKMREQIAGVENAGVDIMKVNCLCGIFQEIFNLIQRYLNLFSGWLSI